MTFTKGEELVITGSKVKQGDSEMVLARQVVRGHGNTGFTRRERQSGVELAALN